MSFRGRRRPRRQVHWIGAATALAAGEVNYTNSGTAGTLSFGASLWTAGSMAGEAVVDDLQYDARIERILGSCDIRAYGGAADNSIFWRVYAGIIMQPLVFSEALATDYDDGAGAITVWDQSSYSSNQARVLAGRWLWMRQWILADPNSTLPYPSTTAGYIGKRFEFDIKPRVRLQWDRQQRRIWAPRLVVQCAPFNNSAGSSAIYMDMLFWRSLWSKGSSMR